jgi:hypothetical protein
MLLMLFGVGILNSVEKDIQSDIPPVQPVSPTPLVTPASANLLKILVVILTGLIVVTGSVFVGIQIGKKQTPIQPPPIAVQPTTPPAIPTNNPLADWETYTNSDLRLSFKYPGSLFVYKGDFINNSQYWANKAGGGPMDLGLDGLWMDVSITKPDAAALNTLSNKINTDQPGSGTATASEVLQILDTGGVRGVVYYDSPKPNTEATYSYTAMWVRNQTLYKLFMAAFTESTLTRHKNTFDQMVSSFRFTD